jgi:hypothetical protein
LRPKDIFENDGANHHAKDEEPTSHEKASEYAAKDTDAAAPIKCTRYSERGILREE